MKEMEVRSLDQEDPLEEGMATHSRILAWEISWTEEPGDLRDCSPPGSSVHGILQARILEWVVLPSSRGSS